MPDLQKTAAELGAKYGQYGFAVSLVNTVLLGLILIFK
jgi:hypothetical protein